MVDYDAQAGKWKRDSPKHHSDFCGRPEILANLELLSEVCGWDVTGVAPGVALDLGCGEGYFSRKMAAVSENVKVVGVDKSEGMVALAREEEARAPKGIEYHVGDVMNMPFIQSGSVDVCVGNYITNYIHPDELSQFYMEMARVLRQDGRFALLMPHPAFELCTDFGEAIQYEGTEGYTYAGSRGQFFPGIVRAFDGEVMEVGLIHSTLEDHFEGIFGTGFVITKMEEPDFPKEIAGKYPVFKDLPGKVACLILVGEKLPSEP